MTILLLTDTVVVCLIFKDFFQKSLAIKVLKSKMALTVNQALEESLESLFKIDTQFLRYGLIPPDWKFEKPEFTENIKEEQNPIFISKGQIYHSYSINMGIFEEEMKKMDKLLYPMAENPSQHVQHEFLMAENSRNKLKSAVSQFCEQKQSKQKRLAFVTTLAVALISSVIGAGATAGI